VVRGEAAYLICAQATRLDKTPEREIYQLRTEGQCRLAVFDVRSRNLVIFDGAALADLAIALASGQLLLPEQTVIDPPSRL
jgi:hypothetical protein